MSMMMMNIKGKKVFYGLLLLPVLFFFLFICVQRMGPLHNRQLELHTFRSGDGWGYQVICNKKIFVHQPTIPAIDTVMPFPSEKSAKHVGALVLGYLRSNRSPALTREEVMICLSD